MPVTTYPDLYELVKANNVRIVYDKSDPLNLLTIDATLKLDLIPDPDSADLTNFQKSTWMADYHTNQFTGSDSDLSNLQNWMANDSDTQNPFTPPEWMKIYSTNYGFWVNLDISKIESVEVIGA